MRVDFGDKKITVNAVAPGGIKTDMYHACELSWSSALIIYLRRIMISNM